MGDGMGEACGKLKNSIVIDNVSASLIRSGNRVLFCRNKISTTI